jgi:hypothetical protein
MDGLEPSGFTKSTYRQKKNEKESKRDKINIVELMRPTVGIMEET